MTINKKGYSLVIFAVIVVAALIIASVALFVFKQQTDKNEVSDNANMSNISAQEKSTNQQAVDTIENEIKDINLEDELPSSDLDEDINTLL